MAVKRYDGSAWQVVAGKGDQGPSSSISTWVKTASGGETSLSGNDDNSQALSYTVGQELVFINGTLLKRGADYTATDGTTITGLTALAANDVATVWTVNAFSVANTYTQAQVDNAFVNKSGYFAAGKNKIINGDFNINQRAFTSITTSAQYGFDRWALGNVGNFGTVTYTPETFTLGAAPVAGYEGKTFARVVTTGQTQTNVLTTLRQPIESVRTFANDTVTVSFWAKAASGTPKIAVNLEQNFGTGGSPSSSVDNYLGQATLTTSWVRYSVTGSVASISGKTLGTANNDYLLATLIVSAGTDFNAKSGSLGIQSNTFDIWGVQVEAGSVATAFQTATGTLAGELAACQRYYVRFNDSTNSRANIGSAIPYSTTNALALVYLPVTMRVAPTAIEWANLETSDVWAANQTLTTVTLASTYASNKTLGLDIAFGGSYTNYRPYFLRQANNTAGYLGVIAEL